MGQGSGVRGMGRGVVWDLRVINPALSLTSSWCRNNPVSRDSSSLVESLLGFPMAVFMQYEEDATFWWRAFPLLGLFLSPISPARKAAGYRSSLVITTRTVVPLLGRLSLLGAGIGPFESG